MPISQFDTDVQNYLKSSNNPLKLGDIQESNSQYSPSSQELSNYKKKLGELTDKPFYDDAKEVGKAAIGGAVVDLPEMVGRAAQALSPENSAVSKWGKGIVKSAQDRAEEWKNDMTGRGGVASAMIGGARMLAPSVASLPAYLAGPAVGSLATLALYGGSQYTDVRDRALREGLSKEEAHSLAIKSAGIEGFGELISNKLSLGLLGAGSKAAKTLPGVIKGATDTSTLKNFGKAYAKELVGENLTEGLQQYGETNLEANKGIGKPQSLAESFGETVGPTTALTAFLAPFGLAGHYQNTKRAEAINRVLDDPSSTSPVERQRVVDMLSSHALESGIDKKEVDSWKNDAILSIKDNKPINRFTESEVTLKNPIGNKEQDKAWKGKFDTGEDITSPEVAKAYHKFQSIYNISEDPTDSSYSSSREAVITSLKDIINPGKDKKADPIKAEEAKKALDLIYNAHSSKERQWNKLQEAAKAYNEQTGEVENQSEKPEESDSSKPETQVEKPEEPVVPKDTVSTEDTDTNTPSQIDPEELKRLMDEDTGFNRDITEEPVEPSIPMETPSEQSSGQDVTPEGTVPAVLSNNGTTASSEPVETPSNSNVEALQEAPKGEAVQPYIPEEAKAPEGSTEVSNNNKDISTYSSSIRKQLESSFNLKEYIDKNNIKAGIEGVQASNIKDDLLNYYSASKIINDKIDNIANGKLFSDLDKSQQEIIRSLENELNSYTKSYNSAVSSFGSTKWFTKLESEIKKATKNAKQNQETSSPDGSSSTQPTVQEKTRDTSGNSQGFQSGRQEDRDIEEVKRELNTLKDYHQGIVDAARHNGLDGVYDVSDPKDTREPREILKESKQKLEEINRNLQDLGERVQEVKYSVKEVSQAETLSEIDEGIYEDDSSLNFDDESGSYQIDRFMFAGEKSNTANLKGLSEAKSRLESGDDKELVRRETGWFKGIDGKWRYEIDDSQASFKIPFNDIEESPLFGDRKVYKLSDVLDHPQLFSAYPHLNDISFIKQKGFMDFGGLQGFFTPSENVINITPYATDPLSTLLHEIQHSIQVIEIFAKGGNEESALKALSPERLKSIAEGLHNSFLGNAEKLKAEYEIAKKIIDRPEYKEYLKLKLESDIHWNDFKGLEDDFPELAADSKDKWYKSNKKADNILRGIARELGFVTVLELPYGIYRDSDIKSGETLDSVYKLKKGYVSKLLEDALTEMDKVSIIRSGSREGLINLLKESGGTFGFYESLAGEVESRNVQARQNLSIKERLETPISQTQDVKDDIIIITFKNPEELKSQVQSNQSINKKTFDSFLEKISDSVKSKVQFHFIPDFKTYDKWEELHGFSKRASNQMAIGRGLFHTDNDGKYHIFMNGSIDSNSFKETFVHETIGHFGSRGVISMFSKKDPGSVLSRFDNYLTNLINSTPSLRQAIADRYENWKIYHSRYIAKDMVGNETIDQYFDRKKKGEDYLEFTVKVKDAPTKIKIPTEVALQFADEHIAELAKELVFDEKFIEREVGYGARESEVRTRNRSELNKWLSKVLSRIKHYLRSIFGEYTNSISEQDLKKLIAKSVDTIFDDIDKSLLSLDKKVVRNQEGNFVQVEQESTEDSFLFDPFVPTKEDQLVEKAESISKDSVTLQNPEGVVDLINSGFTELNKTWRDKQYEKLDTLFREHPLLSSLRVFKNMPATQGYQAITNIFKGKIAQVEDPVAAMHKLLEGMSPSANAAAFEYMTTAGANVEDLNLTPIQKRILEKAKRTINELGKASADLGLISKESYEKNKDAYLHTMYLKYLSQYRGSGKSPSVLSWMKKEKKLNAEYKAALGEIKDVRFLIAETIGVIARDHVLINMLNTINNVSQANKLYWVLSQDAKVSHPWDNRRKMTVDEAYSMIADMEYIAFRTSDTERNITFDGKTSTIEALKKNIELLKQRVNAVEEKVWDEAFSHFKEQGWTTSTDRHEFLTKHYKRIPNLPKFGKLRGQFVRNEIFDDLDVYISSYDLSDKNEIEKLFARGGTLERFNRFWKQSMVAFNPGSWVRNIFGTFSLLDLGTPTPAHKLVDKLYEEVNLALKYKTPSKFWKLSRDYGMFGTTYSAIELNAIYSAAKDDLESARISWETRTKSKLESSLPILDDRLTALSGIARNLTEKTKKGYHKASITTSQWYAFLEGAFKTVAFRDYIERWEKENPQFTNGVDSLSEEQKVALFARAAEEANNNIIDYSQAHSWVKTLNRLPFGAPFLTYTYKSLPIMLKSMVKHPIKFAKYATMPALLTAISAAINDWDDKDIDKFKSRLPEYYRHNPGVAFLPVKDATGRPQILSLEYLIPWSPWLTAIRKVMANFEEDMGVSPISTTIKSATYTLPRELGILGGPVPSTISAYLSGKDEFTGREIMTPGASADQQLFDVMKYAYNMSVPSWVSSHGWFVKMYEAFVTEEKNQFGELKYTPLQAVSDITGFRTVSVNEKGGLYSRQKEFQKELRDLNTYRNQIAKDQSMDTQSKFSKIRDIVYREKLLRERMRSELNP